MKKIAAVVWHSHATTLRRAAEAVAGEMAVKVYSARFLDEGKEDFAAALNDLEAADLIFFYRSAGETVWAELEAAAKDFRQPVVCVAHDPALWGLSTVPVETVARSYGYIVQGGVENFARLLRYVAATVLEEPLTVKEPLVFPWQGIYHPDAPGIFNTVEDYLAWHGKPGPYVGLLFARNQWVNGTLAVEDALIRALEARGLVVIPAFCYSLKDEGLGTKGSGEVVREFFFDAAGQPRIAALVKLLAFFLAARARTDDFIRESIAASGVKLLKQLGVPVFQPVVSFYKSVDEWAADPQGLAHDIAWTVALPEFEGVIEPVFLGAARRRFCLIPIIQLRGGDSRAAPAK
jgi:cobaltochelatase CobN